MTFIVHCLVSPCSQGWLVQPGNENKRDCCWVAPQKTCISGSVFSLWCVPCWETCWLANSFRRLLIRWSNVTVHSMWVGWNMFRMNMVLMQCVWKWTPKFLGLNALVESTKALSVLSVCPQQSVCPSACPTRDIGFKFNEYNTSVWFSQSDIQAIISAPYLFGVVTFVLFAVATPNKYGDLLFESRVTSRRLRECNATPDFYLDMQISLTDYVSWRAR